MLMRLRQWPVGLTPNEMRKETNQELHEVLNIANEEQMIFGTDEEQFIRGLGGI